MHEVKERRRKWAKKLTPRQPRQNKNTIDVEESETPHIPKNKGMLQDDIFKLLAANEKYSLYTLLNFWMLFHYVFSNCILTKKIIFPSTGRFSLLTRRTSSPTKNQKRRNPNSRGNFLQLSSHLRDSHLHDLAGKPRTQHTTQQDSWGLANHWPSKIVDYMACNVE